jgi:Ser-tRNA(Ala) deacylase AlaX
MEKRRLTERNHSATHLAAQGFVRGLRRARQSAGLLCRRSLSPFRLLSSTRKLSKEELSLIEAEGQREDRGSDPEKTEVLPIEEAKKLGAEMEFAEKYGAVVRVVEFGDIQQGILRWHPCQKHQRYRRLCPRERRSDPRKTNSRPSMRRISRRKPTSSLAFLWWPK